MPFHNGIKVNFIGQNYVPIKNVYNYNDKEKLSVGVERVSD